jgi:outer membrane protein
MSTKNPSIRSAVLVAAAGAVFCATTAAQNAEKLSLQKAEQIAIQNHPQVQAAADLAVEAKAEVTQAKSAYYPIANGSVTAVDAENNSRVAAGALNNSIIYEREANGVMVNQLVTDFGRTHELVKSSNLHAKAQQENVVTTRADVLLAVDQSYFGVQKAEAELKVAQETVKARQLVSDQISALEQNKIKSGLDVSFANVDLGEAQLLLVQAQNDLDATNAQLAAALGYGDGRTFELEEEPLPPAPPTDFADLLQQAIHDRPELIGMKLDAESAHAYATAERDLWLPTISAAGAAGLTPVGAPQLAPRYAAGGVNVNIPIFNGHLFGALRTEAKSRAQADDQYLRDMQNKIVRDVRTAWLNANSAFQRIALTDQLLKNANQALDLAQQRYKLGLSSIIELSQAQLNETQAELQSADAKFDYQAQISALKYQAGQLQ